MQFLEKLQKILESRQLLTLSQHKEKETIWRQNQIIILRILSQKVY